MGVFQSLILGIIQGLTEFLPISSSGHLIFLPKLFGWAEQGLAFDTVIHLGTLLAVVFYFRGKLKNIVSSFFQRGNFKFQISNFKFQSERQLGLLILLATIPAAIVGFFWGDWIEANARSASVIAFGMIFWGVVLWVADQFSKKQESKKTIKQTSWRNSLFIGCAQAIALIPGVSRSGITMTAGLFSKLDKKSAAEFSFLMSAPIIFLAGLSQVFSLIQNSWGGISLAALLIGLISSALSGFVAIWGLMKIVQRWSYTPFVIYRVIVGVLILLILM